jgi:putative hemolysin
MIGEPGAPCQPASSRCHRAVNRLQPAGRIVWASQLTGAGMVALVVARAATRSLEPIAPPLAPAEPGEVLARAGCLGVALARDEAEIAQAQRLRHRVFAGELGARIADPGGLDRDIFDAHCLHLIVRDHASDEVVGTYRVLMPAQARRLGCLYTEQEFWLTRLDPIRDELVELGRSCVHPAWRGGATIMLLWSAIGALLARSGHRYLIGCASVPMHDGGAAAASLYRQLAQAYLAPEPWRVWPRERLAVESFPTVSAVVPPLLKGYLRAGAQLLGEPHCDAAFGCADFPLMLSVDALAGRYRRRFAG